MKKFTSVEIELNEKEQKEYSVALVSITKSIIPFLNEIFQVFPTLIRYLKSQNDVYQIAKCTDLCSLI